MSKRSKANGNCKVRCTTPMCDNFAEPSRKLCSKCRSRLRRIAHPIEYLYNNLKFNARRRKKEFTISLQYFKNLVAGTGYVEHHGRGSHQLTIEREDNDLGYVPGNLSVKTKAYNSAKANLCSVSCIEKSCRTFGCLQRQSGDPF